MAFPGTTKHNISSMQVWSYGNDWKIHNTFGIRAIDECFTYHTKPDQEDTIHPFWLCWIQCFNVEMGSMPILWTTIIHYNAKKTVPKITRFACASVRARCVKAFCILRTAICVNRSTFIHWWWWWWCWWCWFNICPTDTCGCGFVSELLKFFKEGIIEIHYGHMTW